MKVLKFGGTSVGSAQRMKEVSNLILDGKEKIVVLSAMSGTTNTLVEISDYLYKRNTEAANETISKLVSKYNAVIDELYQKAETKQVVGAFLKERFDYLRSFSKNLFTLFEEKVVLAQGEILSTTMFTYYLQEQGVSAVLLPALEFMRVDKNGEPDTDYIRENLNKQLAANKDIDLFITQGFICLNAYGEIDNLQRGGSDYSASLIGAAVNATEIQIWTHRRMHNNDPRFVTKTTPVFTCTLKKLPSWPISVPRFCIPPVSCLPNGHYSVRLLNTMQMKPLVP